jgi:hypothetical protein
LLKVLQGESVATSPTQETVPLGFETGSSGKQDTEENPKSTEVLMQEVEASLSNPLGTQAKAQIEDFPKARAGYISFYTSHICCQYY